MVTEFLSCEGSIVNHFLKRHLSVAAPYIYLFIAHSALKLLLHFASNISCNNSDLTISVSDSRLRGWLTQQAKKDHSATLLKLNFHTFYKSTSSSLHKMSTFQMVFFKSHVTTVLAAFIKHNVQQNLLPCQLKQCK